MKFGDLKVGMEVLVLHRGTRKDLGNADVRAAVVLSAEQWKMSSGTAGRQTTVSDDVTGEQWTVFGWPDPQGAYVAVRCQDRMFWNGGVGFVGRARILGLVDEWQPKVDAARRTGENEV